MRGLLAVVWLCAMLCRVSTLHSDFACISLEETLQNKKISMQNCGAEESFIMNGRDLVITTLELESLPDSLVALNFLEGQMTLNYPECAQCQGHSLCPGYDSDTWRRLAINGTFSSETIRFNFTGCTRTDCRRLYLTNDDDNGTSRGRCAILGTTSTTSLVSDTTPTSGTPSPTTDVTLSTEPRGADTTMVPLGSQTGIQWLAVAVGTSVAIVICLLVVIGIILGVVLPKRRKRRKSVLGSAVSQPTYGMDKPTIDLPKYDVIPDIVPPIEPSCPTYDVIRDSVLGAANPVLQRPRKDPNYLDLRDSQFPRDSGLLLELQSHGDVTETVIVDNSRYHTPAAISPRELAPRTSTSQAGSADSDTDLRDNAGYHTGQDDSDTCQHDQGMSLDPTGRQLPSTSSAIYPKEGPIVDETIPSPEEAGQAAETNT